MSLTEAVAIGMGYGQRLRQGSLRLRNASEPPEAEAEAFERRTFLATVTLLARLCQGRTPALLSCLHARAWVKPLGDHSLFAPQVPDRPDASGGEEEYHRAESQHHEQFRTARGTRSDRRPNNTCITKHGRRPHDDQPRSQVVEPPWPWIVETPSVWRASSRDGPGMVRRWIGHRCRSCGRTRHGTRCSSTTRSTHS